MESCRIYHSNSVWNFVASFYQGFHFVLNQKTFWIVSVFPPRVAISLQRKRHWQPLCSSKKFLCLTEVCPGQVQFRPHRIIIPFSLPPSPSPPPPQPCTQKHQSQLAGPCDAGSSCLIPWPDYIRTHQAPYTWGVRHMRYISSYIAEVKVYCRGWSNSETACWGQRGTIRPRQCSVEN